MQSARSVAVVAATWLTLVVTAAAVPASAATVIPDRIPGVERADTADQSVELTYEWGEGFTSIPISYEFWQYDETSWPDNFFLYYRVGQTHQDGRFFPVMSSDASDEDAWQAPSTFSFRILEQDSTRTLTGAGTVVHVTVTNIPQDGKPSADDITPPTVVNGASNADFGKPFDTGRPIANMGNVSRSVSIDVTHDEVSGTCCADTVEFTVEPLNEQMATYFTVKTPRYRENGWQTTYMDLVAKRGAPVPPPSYWTMDWFDVDYTVNITKHHPRDTAVTKDFTFDRTVQFSAPTMRFETKQPRFFFRREVGYTVWSGVGVDGHGVQSGSYQLHLKKLPASLRRHFSVVLDNPARATQYTQPRVGIRPRTKEALRMSFPLTWRASVVDRAGVRHYTDWTTHTVSGKRAWRPGAERPGRGPRVTALTPRR
ncbi:MAG: hypothetical protein ABF306_03580 [Nocardioides marinisabuli]|uniref:hypothetical protein n=1 Tax=Nocardioides marinisabuli TaxID=419476 RepID=UPI00321BD558